MNDAGHFATDDQRLNDAGHFATDEMIDSVELDYAGCLEVWLETAPRCIFQPDTPLRLWVDVADPDLVTVLVDGQEWPAEQYIIEELDGFGLAVDLPFDASQLDIEFAEPRSRWSLHVRVKGQATAPQGIKTSHDVDSMIAQAFMRSTAGDYHDALRMLADIEDDVSRYPKGRADLATYRGIVQWAQGSNYDAATSLRQGVTFAMKLHDTKLETSLATGLGLSRQMSASGVDMAVGLQLTQAAMLRAGEDVGRYRVWVR